MRHLIDMVRATRVLLVDPDPVVRAALSTAVGRSARVDACSSFQSARLRLESTAYDLVVTSVRLKEYNGLHLVYLAKHTRPATHAVVYDDHDDIGLAVEVQRAHAFYEPAHKVGVTLPTYIGAALPAVDRRTPTTPDRRLHPRGGRRRWDRHVIGLPLHEGETGITPADT